MAHDEAVKTTTSARLVVRNIGLLLSGDLANPILDADTVVAVDGKISAIGKKQDIDTEGANVVIDARAQPWRRG
jgi:enamidase